MNESNPPSEHREAGHEPDIWETINKLLDQYAAILRAERFPNDPDYQARKASIQRQLDEYHLDADHRRKKIAAMTNETAAAYQLAIEELAAKPKDILAKVRYDQAVEKLSRAIFMSEVDRVLMAAQMRGDTRADEGVSQAEPQAIEKVLDDMRRYRQLLDEQDIKPEEIRDKLAYELNTHVMTIIQLIKTVGLRVREAKQPEHQVAWRRIEEEVRLKRLEIKANFTDLVVRLNVPGMPQLEHPTDLTDELRKKPVTLLSAAMRDADLVLQGLIEVNNMLVDATKRKTG